MRVASKQIHKLVIIWEWHGNSNVADDYDDDNNNNNNNNDKA